MEGVGLVTGFQFFSRLAAGFAEGLDLNIDVELQRGPLPELIS